MKQKRNHQTPEARPEMKYMYFPVWPPHGEDLIGVAIHFDPHKADEEIVYRIIQGMLRGVFLTEAPLRKEYYRQNYPEEPRWWGVVPEFHRQWLGQCACLACEAEREDYARDPQAAKAAQDKIKERVAPILEDLKKKGDIESTGGAGFWVPIPADPKKNSRS